MCLRVPCIREFLFHPLDSQYSKDPKKQTQDMLSDGDLFEKQLPQTFRFNLTASRRISPKDCKPHHPVSFYDRHLDANMVLQRVEINHSIPNFLYQLYKKAFKGFLDAGHSLTEDNVSPFRPFRLEDGFESTEIGFRYEANVALCCYSIASRIFFHPSYPSRESVFYFAVKSVQGPGTKFLAEGSLTVDNRVTNPPDEAVPDPFLDESAISRLKDLEMQSAGLASWEMYAMTSPAHKLLKSMQTSDFIWDKPHMRGVPLGHQCLPVPPDANTEFLSKIRHGQRSKQKMAVKKRPAHNFPVSTSRVKTAPALPHHANTKGRPYRPDPSHYLQRASTAS